MGVGVSYERGTPVMRLNACSLSVAQAEEEGGSDEEGAGAAEPNPKRRKKQVQSRHLTGVPHL
jgi:hypothetical protein